MKTIMSKTVDKTITDAQLTLAVNQALATLKKDRDRLVIAKRHGVAHEKVATLESIGQQLGITRERVRQIEKATLNRLRDAQIDLDDLYEVIDLVLFANGDIISFDELLASLGLTNKSAAELAFLIKLNPDYVFLGENDDFYAIITRSSNLSEADIKKLHANLVETVTQLGRPMKFENITKHIDGPHDNSALIQLATASKHLACHEQSWGLACWPEINPKSIRDKAYLVLKKSGRPMHFSDIAAEVVTIKPNAKQVTTQAVHNELIKDKRFVLIGRGIYALGSWGYENGTVADIIAQVLADESPLTKDEIVRRVLLKRQVKPTTIVLNLQEKNQFERVGKATYQLKSV